MAGRSSSLTFLGRTFKNPSFQESVEDPAKPVAEEKKEKKAVKACGLCGKTIKLTKTPCCNNWICDDHHKYKIMSYSRVSCHRNHDRYTLCGYHFSQEHPGHWQNCKKCRKDFVGDLGYYVEIGTNIYNFEKLKNPPAVDPATKPDLTIPGGRTIWLNPEFQGTGFDPSTFNPSSLNLSSLNFFNQK